MAAQNKNNKYQNLKEKWGRKHDKIKANLWEKHGDSLDWLMEKTKQFTVGGASLLLLASPKMSLPIPQLEIEAHAQKVDKKVFLISNLENILPKEMKPLTDDEEKKVSEILSRDFGVKAVPELLGKRLNRSYGLIGQEQHLARYRGDNISVHFDSSEDAVEFSSYGMAPGLGGWGYFQQKDEPLNRATEREKYYIAVPTFLAPGFKENPRKIIDFFKFRKMLVVNPQNGKAVVAVVGDAGPAQWTGKHLGGSPEVMNYLERYDGSQRGPVLYFFIDDPENKIPLGPIEVL